jgi:RHS repeat-associated protein
MLLQSSQIALVTLDMGTQRQPSSISTSMDTSQGVEAGSGSTRKRSIKSRVEAIDKSPSTRSSPAPNAINSQLEPQSEPNPLSSTQLRIGAVSLDPVVVQTEFYSPLPLQVPPIPPTFASSKPAAIDLPSSDLVTSVPLIASWNLISIPEEPDDTDPAVVLASIDGAYTDVYAYDGCDTSDPWKQYDPADPGSSDLTAIDHRNGLWIEMTTPASLDVDGTLHSSTDIPLCEGWNLVGYPLNQVLPVAGALSSIEGKYSRVFAYDPTDAVDPWQLYDPSVPDWVNDLQTMEPGRGYWILATENVTLTISEPDPPPMVEISNPVEGEEVTSPTDVLGSVASTTTAVWTLEHTLKDEDTWIQFASGDTSVTGDVLGSFDPTLLLNGMHEIRLTATDLFGQSSFVSVNVVVAGDMKVGHFTLSFIDLDIPVAGIPIQIIRTYDSRDKRTGDFGVGWTLDIKNLRVEENGVIGQNWLLTKSIGPIPTYCVQPTVLNIVSVTLPNGKVERYEPTVTPECQPIAPPDFVTIGFRPSRGTHGTLAALDGIDAFVTSGVPGPVELINIDTGLLYDPDEYQFTLKDGRAFSIDEHTGLESITDLNGNTLTITRDGLIHSSGKSVPFDRDSQERITSITDPNNTALTYLYDANGDLTSFTDREGNTTTFTYLTTIPHHLDGIEDPRGIQTIRNDYDDDGRLIQHTDALGNTIEYTHDIDTRQEVIVDREGEVRVLEYNDRGNVVKETDPDGKIVLRTFDDRDNLLSETEPHHPGNPDPSTTTYTYDADDNRISTTDPLGNVTALTFDDLGQVLTSTDPLGNVTSNIYDANGNLLSTTDAFGNTTSSIFDSQGNVLTSTDAAGNVIQYEYDSSGNLIKETDPLGTESSYTYNANGNRLTQTTQRTTPSGPEVLTTTFFYDKQGKLIRTTDPDGTNTRTVFDSMGQEKEKIDKLGRVTSYVYDDLGRLTKIIYPDGSSEENTFDAEGRQKTRIDRAGRITSYEYGANDQLTKVTLSDGTSTVNMFDDAGNLAAITDALGNTTTFEYDATGKRTRVVDPLGNETRFAYDANGNQISTTNPSGETTLFEYDALNQKTKTIFPDGSSISITYDSLGQRISETDQAGRTTQFEYDALGRLTKVTDALGQLTAYTYDEIGNRISQTDANGHTTLFEYDKLGRETRQTLPDGSVETKAYDAAGNLTSRTDFAGNTTTFTYDVNRQLTNRTYPDSSTVTFTYTATGMRSNATDARGTTSYAYNDRDLLTSLTYPDGRRLEYQYDAVGNRTSMTATLDAEVLTTSYTYDAAGRLTSVTDPDGETYGHAYDPNGNRISLSHPNLVTTTYTYDTLNRLTDLTTIGPGGPIQSYQFTLGLSGNREKITELDGTAREYTYDAVYRLTGERVSDAIDLVYENTFTYDPVGNRLTQITTGSGAGSIDYTYDTRDRLLDENTISYSWDNNGNLTSKSAEATYFWDFENRLIRVEKTDGTIVKYTYDTDGNRVRTETTPPSSPSTVTNYLVDPTGMLSHVVAETDDVDALIAYYVRGDDLLSVIRPSETRFYHADGHGSVRLLTDDAGNISDRYAYTAFGELLSHTGSDPNPYLFVGEPYDPNVGFYYLRARYFNPKHGRFVSSDTWAGNIFDPTTLHKYLYAHADPVNRVDPSGHFSYMGALTVGAIIATIASIAIPAYRAALWKLTGKTDEFSMQFLVGGIGGQIVFGGAVAIYIWEEGIPFPISRGLFTVFMFGLGVGLMPAGTILPNDPIQFDTVGTRRIEDFAGIGNIATAEIGGVIFVVAYGGMVLPDGTVIEPSMGKGAAFAVGPAIFSVMAVWWLRELTTIPFRES